MQHQIRTFIHHFAKKPLHRGVIYQLSVRLNHGTNDQKYSSRLKYTFEPKQKVVIVDDKFMTQFSNLSKLKINH